MMTRKSAYPSRLQNSLSSNFYGFLTLYSYFGDFRPKSFVVISPLSFTVVEWPSFFEFLALSQLFQVLIRLIAFQLFSFFPGVAVTSFRTMLSVVPIQLVLL